MDEVDICCVARLLLERHGLLAVDRACDRLRELCVAGDIEGCAAWARVLAAINELRRDDRRNGEAVN